MTTIFQKAQAKQVLYNRRYKEVLSVTVESDTPGVLYYEDQLTNVLNDSVFCGWRFVTRKCVRLRV